MKIGILALGRPTFDVDYATTQLTQMFGLLDQSGHTIVGQRELLFNEQTTKQAVDELKKSAIDQLLILQVTFTDAAMVIYAAQMFEVPLSIWAIPEPRMGGRLRINSFCGLNLASHALSLNNRRFSWLYTKPQTPALAQIERLFAGSREIQFKGAVNAPQHITTAATQLVARLKGKRIGRIGAHPVGFDTCAYSAVDIHQLAGIEVDALELSALFEAAKNATAEDTQAVRAEAENDVGGLEAVDQTELDKSLRLKVGLDQLRKTGGYDAFAIRCWPETFTEYGGAICGPVAMMGEAKIPCACEADVYGALTQMILQEATGEAVFLTDLVDLDTQDNTGVVWHCGQAPISMRAMSTEGIATVHTNRKMPLLYEFSLKPGPVTMLRISQSYNTVKMTISYGEILDRPMAFTGTSGVIRYANPAEQVLTDILGSGLEHHMALAYGDHRQKLRAVASAMNLPILEL